MVVVSEKKRQLATETVEAQPPSKKPLEGENAETMLKELREELEKEKAKSEDYLRRLQYLQADFENYRKRAEREMGDVKRYGNERLLSDLLVVVDELELGLEKAREGDNSPALVEGIRMVLKRFQGLLAKE